MRKCVIIHGTHGHSEENWFPWLKNKLESNNQYQVYIPNFPTPENQNLESWLNVLKSDFFKFDSNTILVGHSLGASFILSFLEKRNLPIKATFLVSGFIGPIGNEKFDDLNKDFTEKEFNWEKIKNNAGKIFLYHSDNDPYVPIEKAFELAKYLSVDPIIINSAGHFNLRAGYDRFEELYNDIINLDNN